MTTHVFLDTAPLLFAVGDPHPLRVSCREILTAAQAGELRLHVSAEAIREFAHHRLRRTDRPGAVAETRDVLALCHVHDVGREVLLRMLELIETTPLRGPSAVHAATALGHGFDHIVTSDDDFDDAPGLRRIAPGDIRSI